MLCGKLLPCVHNIYLLKVMEHILFSNIVQRLDKNSTLMIRRNVHNCPQYVQNQAYASLVRLILGHACCVWDPYQRKHIK